MRDDFHETLMQSRSFSPESRECSHLKSIVAQCDNTGPTK